MNREIAKSLKSDRKRIERELRHNTRMLKLAGVDVTRKKRKTKTKTRAKAAVRVETSVAPKKKVKIRGSSSASLAPTYPSAPTLSKRDRAEQLAAAD